MKLRQETFFRNTIVADGKAFAVDSLNGKGTDVKVQAVNDI